MDMKRRWQDGVGLLLGAGLFFAPFFGLGPMVGLAAWDDYLFGVMVVALSVLALALPWLRQEKSCLLAGLWLIAAPFVLGFASDRGPTLTHLAIGLLLVVDVLMVPGARNQGMPMS